MCQFEHLEPNIDIENISDIEIDENNDEAINNLVNCENDDQNKIDDISESESD